MERVDPSKNAGHLHPPFEQRAPFSPKVQSVMNRLAADIVAKRYGTVLPPQDVLAAKLGVSRTVLREAVSMLIARGMLEARPRTGTRVRPCRDWIVVNEDVLQWRASSGGTRYRIEQEGDSYGLYAVQDKRGKPQRLASVSGASEETVRIILGALEALMPDPAEIQASAAKVKRPTQPN
ncbi:FadR/GntR family transcriptional regulator [Paraburkholderia sp. SIMBA_054]|uniref:FadR/GntR family transcriptional regulator n=1 Tax=Paraburkholderia sp. SIMBA_054 TaxID=3085795 RepID=UPI00397ABBB1